MAMTPAQFRARMRMHQSKMRSAQNRLNSDIRRLERQQRLALQRLRNLR